MAFKCYHKSTEDDSNTSCFCVVDTKKEAIAKCLEKINSLRDRSNDEIDNLDVAARSLELRGYYCIGWSSNEISFEEV